jgi:hypothetical protein
VRAYRGQYHSVKDTPEFARPDTSVRYVDTLGMNENQSFHDMVEFTFGNSCEQGSLLASWMIQNKQVDATSGWPRVTSEIQRKISQINWEVISPKLLGMACGLVLGGMLVAVLWPFHSPRNQVTWFAGGNGLHFGRHEMILSSSKFKAAKVPADAPCGLEIWFDPDLTATSGTLFAFYAPENPRQFPLNQSVTALKGTIEP